MKKFDEKIRERKQGFLNFQAGMSYIELIVVLTIFAFMSSVILFNYGEFQAKVDIKNLASDIALKIIEAQKSSLSGKLPPSAQPPTWKPSYGVYFNLTAGANTGNKVFYYFTDLNQDKLFDYGTYGCPSNECLEKLNITKGNSISEIKVYYKSGGSTVIPNDLQITFTRPNSEATFKSGTVFSGIVSSFEITVVSPKSPTAKINIYPSGRVQVN